MKKTESPKSTQRTIHWLAEARRWTCFLGLAPLLVTSLQAKPNFGADCLECHSARTGKMELVGHDTTADLGAGTLKVYQVEPGQTAAIQLNVINGGSDYGLSVFYKAANGINNSAHQLTIPSPGSPWTSGSGYYYKGKTTANATWTLNVAVDASTPADYYPFESQIGIKNGGEIGQAERFYIQVLSATPANTAPVLAALATQSLDEGATLSVTATATDADTPAQTLTYSLSGDVPQGMSVDAGSGVIIWPTTEADGPGSATVQVTVTDNGTPALSDTQSFTVTVKEVNAAPVLATIPQQTVAAGGTVSFTVSGSDMDIPAQNLTYSLGAGAPAGALIGAGSGAFSWAVPADTAAGITTFEVGVTDDGTPALAATQSVSVVVELQPVVPPEISAAGFTGPAFSLTVTTLAGRTYALEYKTALSDSQWISLPAVDGDGTARVLSDPDPSVVSRFYRIRIE